MNKDANDVFATELTSETFAQTYFNHQYDRFGKLESANLSLTNIVITVSVVAFTFGFENLDFDTLTIVNGLVLPLLIIVANTFAILFIWGGTRGCPIDC